jgi:hypothetical protein
MSKQPANHVVPGPNGGWSVKKSGSERASKHFKTQHDAVAWGREISKERGTELFIHRQDGSIRSKDSYGSDPFPVAPQTSGKSLNGITR